MPKRCGVVNCNGNYDSENQVRVFRLPRCGLERQKWIDVLPPREDFVLDPEKFYICLRHWEPDTPMIKIPGGSTRPANPPSIFNVPKSCLPTPKPAPRQTNVEDAQLRFFLQKDTIASFESFHPEKDLQKSYKNLLFSRSAEAFVCLFMTENFASCTLSIVVENKPTLCSPLTLSAYKDGTSVPLGKILHPNNGLRSYTQFQEAVRVAVRHEIPLETALRKVVGVLRGYTSDSDSDTSDSKKEKKVAFLTRQLELLCHKQYSMADYCFAIESFPRCSYEQLRDYLVLPSTRKLQSIVSAVNKEEVRMIFYITHMKFYEILNYTK